MRGGRHPPRAHAVRAHTQAGYYVAPHEVRTYTVAGHPVRAHMVRGHQVMAHPVRAYSTKGGALTSRAQLGWQAEIRRAQKANPGVTRAQAMQIASAQRG